MRKALIIFVLTLIAAGIFLFPVFTKTTYSVLFPAPVNQIKIVHSSPEIKSVEVTPQNFEKAIFSTVIIQNTHSKLILYGKQAVTPIWYKSSINSGYFQEIGNVRIYSPRQVLFDIGGNLATITFWGALSLAAGLIVIFILSLLE